MVILHLMPLHALWPGGGGEHRGDQIDRLRATCALWPGVGVGFRFQVFTAFIGQPVAMAAARVHRAQTTVHNSTHQLGHKLADRDHQLRYPRN